jgi:hypothetical protein
MTKGMTRGSTDFKYFVTAHRGVPLPVLVGWGIVNHPTDGEFVALASKFFHGNGRMVGEHTLA